MLRSIMFKRTPVTWAFRRFLASFGRPGRILDDEPSMVFVKHLVNRSVSTRLYKWECSSIALHVAYRLDEEFSALGRNREGGVVLRVGLEFEAPT